MRGKGDATELGTVWGCYVRGWNRCHAVCGQLAQRKQFGPVALCEIVLIGCTQSVYFDFKIAIREAAQRGQSGPSDGEVFSLAGEDGIIAESRLRASRMLASLSGNVEGGDDG